MYQPDWKRIAKASPEAQKMAYEGIAEINKNFIAGVLKFVRARAGHYPISPQVKRVGDILRATYSTRSF